MRIVFMGTPDFAVPSLKALLESGYPVVGAVTQPDRPRGRSGQPVPPPVKAVAQQAGVPVLQPERPRRPEAVAELRAWQPDLAVTAAFGQILSREVLAVPRLGCLNVHASLLPRYRGAAPIHRAILDGQRETGITLMWMNEGLDTGDIIVQRAIPIAPDDTAGTLHDKLAALGAQLLAETLPLIGRGQAPRTPQNDGAATYAPKLTREDERIDWQQPALRVVDRVRGLCPWPGAYTLLDGGILKVYKAVAWPPAGADAAAAAAAPGTVVGTERGRSLIVRAGDGEVLVEEVQPQDGRRMAASAFLAGHPIAPGVTLG